MTRQMADDEVLRVLHRMVNRADTPDVFHDLRAIHAAVAALQAQRDSLLAERDALRDEVAARGVLVRAYFERAERAESALEALRGQVAGLVEKWRAVDRATCSAPSELTDCADQLDALLAMKNSGEF